MRSFELEPNGRAKRVAVFIDVDVNEADMNDLQELYGNLTGELYIDDKHVGWVFEMPDYYIPAKVGEVYEYRSGLIMRVEGVPEITT